MATNERHVRQSFYAVDSSQNDTRERGDLVVSDIQYILTPRKPQISEHHLLNDTSQNPTGRQKPGHPAIGSLLPAASWDNLSTVPLTKNALREFNRRRNALAERKEPRQSIQSAANAPVAEDLRDIKILAEKGGPDLSDLKGYPEPGDLLHCTMNSTQKTTTTKKTKRCGPYDRTFQQHLVRHGIYHDGYEYPDDREPPQPKNWEEIIHDLKRPRPSLSSSQSCDREFKRFKQANTYAFKEAEVTGSVIRIIQGNSADQKLISGGICFANLEGLTDGTLVPGNPDIYHGARPEQLDERICAELSGHIIPTTEENLPLAPNFFVAAKGPDGSLAVAGRQATYDGALGARGMHSLQSYGQVEPKFDNNATTISSIYHGGMLQMFACHSAQSNVSKDQPEYFMSHLRSFAMRDSVDTFRQGATAYRNAVDWTRKQRDDAIRRANERANNAQARSLAIDEGNPVEESQSSPNKLPHTTEPETQADDPGTNEPRAKRSDRRSKPPRRSARFVPRVHDG